MTTSLPPSGTPPIPADAVGLRADARTGTRLGAAAFRYHITRPASWVGLLVLIAIFMAVGIGLDQTLQMALLLTVVLTGIGFMQRRGFARVFGRLYPAGSLHWTRFGSTSMTVAGPTAVSEMSYAGFRDVWSSDAVVVLRSAQSRVIHALPIELVPSSDLAQLRSSIGGGHAAHHG